MDVGFIGIGSMGAAMVSNLVKAGHRVGVWNRNAAAAQAVEGVTVLASAEEAFDGDAVVTMLANDEAVRDVILASDALTSARSGCVHVMASTLSLALVGELVARHREAGVAYVAAPVFGVPATAAAAQLNIVAAGAAADLDHVQPLFDAMGRRTWRVGDDPARANVAKIAGNLMIALAIEAMGEATALTESHGLAAADFLDIMTSTLFASPSYQRYGGFIATDSFEPGFKLTLGLKDVNLALEAARAANVALPSAEVVRGHMLAAIDAGFGAKDWSIAAKMAQAGGKG